MFPDLCILSCGFAFCINLESVGDMMWLIGFRLWLMIALLLYDVDFGHFHLRLDCLLEEVDVLWFCSFDEFGVGFRLWLHSLLEFFFSGFVLGARVGWLFVVSFFWWDWADMCCLFAICVRIRHTMFLKKTSLLAFLVLLKNRGGLMPVRNSWLRGWFMVSFDLFLFRCFLFVPIIFSP